MKVSKITCLSLLHIKSATIFTAEAFQVCRSIQSLGIYIQIYPALLSADFNYAKSHFWSAAHADLTPACAVFPNSAQQVSQIVTVLKGTKEVKFSVKSGGHDPNVGHGSVDGGVLISMSRLASTALSKDRKTAEVGPGARWGDVIGTIDPFGVTVVGGRIGDVGVGGFMLGGGLSFLSAQYGFACDSVVNYEVVLAGGNIIHANASSNTDLFWALKGGGSQFDLPIGKVWGGIRTYNAIHAASLINATQDFTENFYDPKAAVIVTGEISTLSILNLLDIFLVFLFYDGPSPPVGVFDKFNAIPTNIDTTKTRTYADFLKSNDAVNFYGLRYLIRGTPLPNLSGSNGKSLLNTHYNTWKYTVTGGLNLLNLRLGYVYTIAFQPIPAAIATHSTAIGGPNPLGLKPEKGDLMWMEYDIAWLASGADKISHDTAMSITTTIDGYVRQTYGGIKNSNAVEGPEGPEPGLEYGPIFLNDAMFDQDPLRSYGVVNFERLKRIQKEVDSDGLFPSRTGGFKFT